MIILIRLNDVDKIINVFRVNQREDLQGTENEDLIVATELDIAGESLMGRTYDRVKETVSLYIPPLKTRRQELKENTTLTDDERDEVLRELL